VVQPPTSLSFFLSQFGGFKFRWFAWAKAAAARDGCSPGSPNIENLQLVRRLEDDGFLLEWMFFLGAMLVLEGVNRPQKTLG